MIATAIRGSLRVLIRAYQLVLSPVLGPNCRFSPSCSHYALQALDRHGVVRGIGLAASRILRCHPWHPGGHDPVPPACACAVPPVRASIASSARASGVPLMRASGVPLMRASGVPLMRASGATARPPVQT